MFPSGVKTAAAVAAIVLACLVVGVTVFHLVHHRMYCRYRMVPGKSHCGVCGHRKTCQKYHFKNEKKEQ